MYTYTITEAATRYGLNSNAPGAWTGLGDINDVTSTFPPDREPDYPATGSVDLHTTTGFTITVHVMLLDADNGRLDRLEIRRKGDSDPLHVMQGDGTIMSTNDLLMGPALQLHADATITGNSAANVLQGWAGNDTIDGGAGTDTAAYAGAKSQYAWGRQADGTIRVSGPDGTDHLVNVERLSFLDGRVAFDAESTGGQAYRLYQAAFNRKPDVGGLGFQIDALDSGHSLKSVAQNFLDSPEFLTLYGSGLDNRAFVEKLYQNVLHRAPDADGLAYQVGALESGLERAQLLVNFSESPENKAALVGTIQAGVEYTL